MKKIIFIVCAVLLVSISFAKEKRNNSKKSTSVLHEEIKARYQKTKVAAKVNALRAAPRVLPTATLAPTPGGPTPSPTATRTPRP